jgi:hypothetical protein
LYNNLEQKHWLYSSEYHYTLKDFIEEIDKSELTIIIPKGVCVLDVIKNGSVIASVIPILFFIFDQYYSTNWNIIRNIEPNIVKMLLL